MSKMICVVFILLSLMASATLSTVQAKTKYLKEEDVKKTMIEFSKALGVKCDFCHTKDRSQNYQDLAGQTVDKGQLSALVYKRIAGAMLGTLLYLNKKEGKDYTCNTCHQGKADVEAK